MNCFRLSKCKICLRFYVDYSKIGLATPLFKTTCIPLMFQLLESSFNALIRVYLVKLISFRSPGFGHSKVNAYGSEQTPKRWIFLSLLAKNFASVGFLILMALSILLLMLPSSERSSIFNLTISASNFYSLFEKQDSNVELSICPGNAA